MCERGTHGIRTGRSKQPAASYWAHTCKEQKLFVSKEQKLIVRPWSATRSQTPVKMRSLLSAHLPFQHPLA